MRNVLLIIAIVYVPICLSALPASAHPVVVDGRTADWTSRSPNAANLGIVVRDARSQGELIWSDAAGDSRTDFASPEREADILSFAVTADATSLYFRVETAAEWRS